MRASDELGLMNGDANPFGINLPRVWALLKRNQILPYPFME